LPGFFIDDDGARRLHPPAPGCVRAPDGSRCARLCSPVLDGSRRAGLCQPCPAALPAPSSSLLAPPGALH